MQRVDRVRWIKERRGISHLSQSSRRRLAAKKPMGGGGVGVLLGGLIGFASPTRSPIYIVKD